MDDEAIRVFMADDYDRLVAAMTLACGEPVVAREAVLDALAGAWEQSARGQEIGALGAYVRVAATNSLRRRWRRALYERRGVRMLAGSDDDRWRQLADPAVSVALDVDLLRAMSALSRRQREVVALHYRLPPEVGRPRQPRQAVRDGLGTRSLKPPANALSAGAQAPAMLRSL